MKAKFTFLAALFLITTSIYALEPAHNKSRKLTGSFLRSRHEMVEKNTERNPLHRKMGVQKQANSLKSAQAIKQRLDSYTSEAYDDSTSQLVPDFKVEFKYDTNWNMIQDLDYELDETTGQLVLSSKVDYSFDAKGNMTQLLVYEFDETTGELVPSWKYDYSFDVNGNMTQEIGYGGYADENETIQLPVTVPDYKETYSYDANGNKTQDFRYDWDKISNQFVIDRKNEYTYDASGNLTQDINSWFDENQSETKNKEEYKYDNKGKLTQTTLFQFSENTNEWIKGNLEEYTYDSKGNKKLIVLTEHTGSINGVEKYVTYNKEEYTYDSEGNNTLILKTHLTGWGSNGGIEEYNYGYEKDEYTYDVNRKVTQYLNSRMENGSWVVYDKNTTVYDDRGNTTQEIGYYNWDEQTNQWMDIWKSEYTFDYKYTTNDLVVPWWWEEEFDSPNSNMITEIVEYNWNNETNQWELDEKVILSYSPVNVTSANQRNAGITSVYPNPCSESVSFSFPNSYSQITFELFDLQGRKIMSKAISNNEKVNMEGYRSGMYLYKLNMDGKIESGKLVKE